MHTSGLLLGIEGGGSKTTAIAVDGEGGIVRRMTYGPGNIRLLDDGSLDALLADIHQDFPMVAGIGFGAAGLKEARELQRVGDRLTRLWPGAPFKLGTDLNTALLAEGPVDSGRMIVISGTGSCCYAETAEGVNARMGGWGHLLGDKGSGYEIGLRALKAVIYYFDRDGDWTYLGESLLRELLLNEPQELIGWVQGASKSAIAGLAPIVFASAKARDTIARDILVGAADSLARDAAACLKKIERHRSSIEVVLRGGVLEGQPDFARKVKRALQLLAPKACFKPVRRESVWGAVELARKALGTGPLKPTVTAVHPLDKKAPRQLSSNEERNPRSMNLDRLSIAAAVDLMNSEDQTVADAVLAQKSQIIKAITLVAGSLKKGGRLFYVGAGSSGRLGVLDASECPPTFRTDTEQVQGIIAGGYEALWRAKEGAEDDAAAGAQTVRFRGVRAGDVVMGIAASGRTPFVWGALTAARQVKARTVLLDFNVHFKLEKHQKIDARITPKIGPEILTGSSRLKAGTATKMVLNMITTLAMVRLGKVRENLMVDLKPSNVKLKDRAVRIVQQLTGCEAAQARASLEAADWVIKEALKRIPKLSA